MNDPRDLYKLFRELESQHQENDTVGLHDSFDLELNEHFVIESGVVGLTEDGIIIQLDEAALEFLDFNGMLTESEEIEEMMVMGADSDASSAGSKTLGEGSSQGVEWAIRQRILYSHKDVVAKYGPVRIMAAIKDRADRLDDLEEIGTSDTSIWTRQVIDDLEKGYYDNADTVPIKRNVGESVEDSDIFAKVVKGDNPFQIIYDGLSGHFGEESRIRLQDMYDDVVIDRGYHPDDDFEQIIDHMDDLIRNSQPFDVSEFRAEKDELSKIKSLALGEAEYQGRKVTLNKPMQGDVAKSKVYVKKPDGKVVKVNFGDKTMRIKKSNPARRKSFRARHNCENPGPKWKARYWSCRMW